MEHNWSEQGVKELAQPGAVPPKGNRPTAPHADKVHGRNRPEAVRRFARQLPFKSNRADVERGVFRSSPVVPQQPSSAKLSHLG
jgi:hypothetical protein